MSQYLNVSTGNNTNGIVTWVTIKSLKKFPSQSYQSPLNIPSQVFDEFSSYVTILVLKCFPEGSVK